MHFVSAFFSLLLCNYYAKTLINFNLDHLFFLYIEKIRSFIWNIIVMLCLISHLLLVFMVVSVIL